MNSDIETGIIKKKTSSTLYQDRVLDVLAVQPVGHAADEVLHNLADLLAALLNSNLGMNGISICHIFDIIYL